MKRFKTRRKYYCYLIKPLICLIIIVISFFYTIKYMYNSFISNNEVSVNRLLALSTNNIIGDITLMDLINFNLSSESILKSSFGEVSIKPNNVKKVSKEVNDPIVYIYNTHQTEEYNPGSLREYNITPTVYMASNMLAKTLNNKEISTIVEDANVKELLNNRGLSYNDSYVISKELMTKALEKYPTLKYFIDLHRDSSSAKISIEDKEYAKMMFVVGMNHDNYKLNEELMININNYLNEKYNGVMRSMFYGKRSEYNQDFNSNTILIEIGGPDNNITEVYNSVLIFAEALDNVIGGA